MSQKEIWRIRKLVQRMVLIDDTSCCYQCGRKKNLHRHHSDGDILNNDTSNIIILCRRCHIKAHLAMGTWSRGLEMAAD